MLRRIAIAFLILAACGPRTEKTATPPQQPVRSILLVTLDTTRADAMMAQTAPSFDALAKRGIFFRQAYTAVPQTLPAHLTMLSGAYPAAHGVHENGRPIPAGTPLIAEKLRAAGYHTAAFVSAFALARRFGVARGFEVFDDDFGHDRAERTAAETTDRALAWLARHDSGPLFLWVHYYDPHYPYAPPPPFRGYLGEVSYMDQQLGRLVAAFEKQAGTERTIVIAGDHGEGLGDHGEQQHGNLLYQSTMHVPLLLIGSNVAPGVSDEPVSTRSVFSMILDGTRAPHEKVVLGEAMKPFLDYGWQPQTMAVQGRLKTILAGEAEVYDVIADPRETRNLAAQAGPSREVRAALRDYPVPSLKEAAAPAALTDEERRQLAALGYVSSTVRPVVRKDAPRPADMAALFPLLDDAAGLFVREHYAESIPMFETILQKDPYNLDAALHLATAHSTLGHERQALDAFAKAQAIAPDSPDVRTYLALHYARSKEWERAVPMLEQILSTTPDKVPAIEALAFLRVKQRRLDEALALRQKLYTLRTPTTTELASLGALAMEVGNTRTAIEAFEHAGSGHDLELGVLYLASRQYEKARAALDRVPSSSRDYPMALFKRAQVSVLMEEPDAAQRIELARAKADEVTRPLIERERLFAGFR